MKYLMMTLATVLMVSATGCIGGGGSGEVSELLGQMPGGYDVYVVIDPEAMDLEGILEILEDNLPDDAIDELEDNDLGIDDPFDWADWKEELGILEGEIGLIVLTEDDDLLAFFLPCGDGAKLKEFVDNSDVDETEFFALGDYTVMVVEWDNDDLLDDLEDALAGDPLSSDGDFVTMSSAAIVDAPCISFFISEDVSEVPFYGVFSSNDHESVLKITAVTDDEKVEVYSEILGSGLQSGNIKFPENTMAAIRYTIDMNWLSEEYESLLQGNGNARLEEIEAGLPFIGFDSLEEFIAVFQGDFCVTLHKLELDEFSEFESIEGTLAISLLDSDKFMSSMDMISMLADADREEIDGITTYEINESGKDIWYFICDDVFYISMNVEPRDIMDGISADDYFGSGVASEGFMGGAVDPEGITEGVHAEDDVEEIITTLFEDRVVFSVAADGQMFTSTTIAGPNALKSFVSLIAVLDGFEEFSSFDD
ncbi:MAG: hypothetical protein KAH54_07520 [Candidatus Sabulitectum sp.]|nr:hypothetical protein [Candidatus Sabulitectum sp.]